MPPDKKTLSKAKTVNSKKPKESKAETFIRLAKPRVQNVLRSLRILSNCSNRANYEYNSEQIDKIFDTLNNAMLECEKKFTKTKVEQETFEF